MPRDGSNVYTLPEAPFTAGTAAVAAAMNNNLADLGAAVSDSVCRSTETTAFTRGLLNDADAATARATLAVAWGQSVRGTASAATAVFFALSGGSQYRLTIWNARLSVSGSIVLRFSTDGGATYPGGASDYSTQTLYASTSSPASAPVTASSIDMTGPLGASDGRCQITGIIDAGSASRTPAITFQTGAVTPGGARIVVVGTGQRSTNAEATHFQFFAGSGGTISCEYLLELVA